MTDNLTSRPPRFFAEASLALAIAAIASVFLYRALPDYDEIIVLGVFIAAPLAIALGGYALTRSLEPEQRWVARCGVGLASFFLIACLIPVNPAPEARLGVRNSRTTSSRWGLPCTTIRPSTTVFPRPWSAIATANPSIAGES